MVVEFQKNDKTKLTNTINNEYVFIVMERRKNDPFKYFRRDKTVAGVY